MAIARSTPEWEALVGERVRAARIRASLEQKALARAANVSVGAVKNLEGGKGSTLKTLIRVLRVLDLVRVLETLPPADTVSPILLARAHRSTLPSRVVTARRKRKP